MQPLLPALGLQTDAGRLLCALSMGAGSMMISHANDAYFWVIAKFAGIEMKSNAKGIFNSNNIDGFNNIAYSVFIIIGYVKYELSLTAYNL